MGERFSIPRIGLGCMGLSEFYGQRDATEMLSALRCAFELGYRHYDTADMYGLGENERLLGRFLADVPRAAVHIASKVGIVRDPDAKYRLRVNGRPEYVREACRASLRRLGTDYLDIYYLHRADPEVDIAETVGALAELVAQGYVRTIGLCEVPVTTLRRAHAEHAISALQSEYSLWSRDVEQEILPACAELGVRFVAFSPLGRGFLTCQMTPDDARALDPRLDLRAHLPRFQAGNVDANYAMAQALSEVALDASVAPAQVSLAWVLQQSTSISAIPGASTEPHLRENFAAASVRLTPAALTRLADLFKPGAVLGGRYPAATPATSG